MTWLDDDQDPLCPGCRASDALLVTAAGGVVNAALIAMLASADAFAARLLNASGQAGQLYALQLRTLTGDIDALRSVKPATTDVDRTVRVDRTVVERGPPPGAPVVT